MNLSNVIFIFTIITIVSAVKKSYEGYKLYKVNPKDDIEVKILEEVQKRSLGEFWLEGFIVNQAAKVMVAPKNQEDFLQFMGARNIQVTEIMMDIQKAINDQLKSVTLKNFQHEYQYLSYSWVQYHDLDTVYKWLDEVVENHPNVAKTVVMGKSVENRDIKGIIINHHPEKNNTIYSVLEGTLHAREWISTATVTWLIKEFLLSTNPEVRALAEAFEWHIFPVVNPDGYVYTFTDNRMWRKNRSPANLTTCAAGDDMSHGVDLNRNFDFHWMSVGASPDPCTNTFAGPAPASEPETKAISEYVWGLGRRGPIMYYLSYHSYSQLFVVPYSHVTSGGALESGNYGDMFEVAIRGADALKKRYGTEYRVGLSADVLYPMSGSSFDWVKSEVKVPFSYLIELRDLGDYGFLLPPTDILPNNLETMDALIAMDKTARRMGYYSSGANGVFYSTFAVLLGVFMVMFC